VNKCKNCQAVLPDRLDGQRGRPREYCNKSCYAIAKGYLKSVFKPEFCLWCGVALDQDNKPGNPKRYCSRQHSGMYLNSKKPKVPKIEKACVWCSEIYTTNQKHSKYCSVECSKAFNNDKRVKATQAKHAANPRRFNYDCDRCGQLVMTDICIRKTYLGRYCRNCSLVKRRERYRVKTAKRQGVAKPARLSADALIERDGNLCRLCNTEIDLALARNSRFGATIDHIVPLSLGGSDDIENMQLAHWICNIKKGNRV
jgi:5-methylcytosine-specific restriction endonuclease McrA